MEQAISLEHVHSLDLVINLRVPFSTIVDRIKGRWTHAKSGRVYHSEFHPPKIPVLTTGTSALVNTSSSGVAVVMVATVIVVVYIVVVE